jgi:anti-anti-sigma regulatory factor
VPRPGFGGDSGMKTRVFPFWQPPCAITSGMLKITLYDGAGELRFRLEGKLSGPWVDELRQCWLTAASTARGRQTILDLSDVDFVDSCGQALLSEMHRESVRLMAATPVIRAVLEEIAATARCATVEEKPARRSHALVSSDTPRSDPRAL